MSADFDELEVAPEHDEGPLRRVELGLSNGATMTVSMPGSPDRPFDEATLAALRAIAEGELRKLASECGFGCGWGTGEEANTWTEVAACPVHGGRGPRR